jgi:hypothetical protein
LLIIRTCHYMDVIFRTVTKRKPWTLKTAVTFLHSFKLNLW